jgi:hypothetical protein
MFFDDAETRAKFQAYLDEPDDEQNAGSPAVAPQRRRLAPDYRARQNELARERYHKRKRGE